MKGQTSPAAILSVALGIGYLVLCFARKEEKLLKKLGYAIGVLIIAISGLMILGKAIVKAHTVYKHGVGILSQSTEHVVK